MNQMQTDVLVELMSMTAGRKLEQRKKVTINGKLKVHEN